MNFKHIELFTYCLLISTTMLAQGVKISTTSGNPDPSAILETQSTTQGLLPPRMTTAQRDAIINPAAGLRIYNTDTACENFFNGVNSRWMSVCGTCPGPDEPTAGSHVPSETQI